MRTRVLKMRFNPFSLDLIVLALLAIAVVLVFRFVPDRGFAATLAGLLFVLVPLGLMIYRFRRGFADSRAKILWWAGVLFFWIGFALPIFFLRMTSSEPFVTLTIFGVPAPKWHGYSNKAFYAMLILVLMAGWLERAKASKAMLDK